jgi:hypothetical protein
MNHDRTQFGDTSDPNDQAQFARDVITTYNENIRMNNQHMLEYNQNMREILAIVRGINTPVQQRPTSRRSVPRAPPPTPPSRHTHPTDPTMRASASYNSSRHSDLAPFGPTESADVYVNNVANDYITLRRSLGPRAYRPRAYRPRALNRETRVPDVSLNVPDVQILSSNQRRPGYDSNFTSMYWRLISEMPGLFNPNTTSTAVSRGLTIDEITVGLRSVDYNPTFHERIDTRCAISLEDFEEGDAITQIIECGHIFKVEHIMRWFERQTKCPVCRYNLRHTMPTDNSEDEMENVVDDESDSESEGEALEASIANHINGIANEFASSIVDSLLTPAHINRSLSIDQSGNVVFQSDISGS